jgi:ATP-binding cassette subfamily B protein
VMSLGEQIVWYMGGREVIGSEFTLGTLFLFTSYLGMFYGPLQWLNQIVDYLARSLASAERVFEILDTEPDIRDPLQVAEVGRFRGEVEFRYVTFGYEAHQRALKRVSFKAEPGEMIGLVGQSGAGKSTTIHLICRFYEALEGEILVDGVDIRRIPQGALRSQIGIVLQEPFLFSGTIYENIAYAKPDATFLEVMRAAKAAHAHDFIVSKPDGYDTVVGERGQRLSGGERQRLSIARAILHDPRILILDEATASVDSDTENRIQDAIARLTRGRTTFAIAHRLSTLRNANRLLVLKGGEIIESGTHEELMAQQGEFHRLVQLQQETSRIMEVGG